MSLSLVPGRHGEADVAEIAAGQREGGHDDGESGVAGNEHG